MGRKLKDKFTVTGSADKPSEADLKAHYSCYEDTMSGSWKKADRNQNYPSDTEGWGSRNVVIFVYSSEAKGRVCAPEPPFGTDNWGDEFFNACYKLLKVDLTRR